MSKKGDPTVSAAVAQIESSSLVMPTLRQRAESAYAALLDAQEAEGRAALERTMTAIVAAAQRCLEIVVTPFVEHYEDGDGVLARYTDTDGAAYVFALLESHRPEITGPGETLYVLRPCARCGKPVRTGAWSYEALGAALGRDPMEHRNCEDEE